MATSHERDHAGTTTLRGGALSLSAATLVGLGYCAIAVSAYAILPYAVSEAGAGALWGVVLTVLAIVPTAACIYLMSARHPSAGGSFTWISEGLGRWTGGTIGFVIVGFIGPLTALLQPAVGGQTFNAILNAFGVQTSFWTGVLGAAITVVICLVLVMNNVTLSTKAVAWLFASEAVFMVLFFGYIIVKQSIAGVFTNPFNSANFVGGADGFKAALIFTVFALAVVDVPVSMAEETSEPHRNIPKMTALILGLAGIIALFSTYALTVAVTPEQLASDISNANEVGPVYLIADQFVGWGKYGVIITTYTSLMALFVATVLFGARFTHAMAREGVAPQWLGRINPKTQTPRNAQILYTVLGIPFVIIVGLWQGGSLGAAYAWGGGVFSGLALLTYMMINLGAIGFFLRRRALGESYNVFLHLVVPVAGALVSAWFVWNAFLSNYLNSDAGFTAAGSIVAACAIWIVIGGIYVAIKLAGRKGDSAIGDRGGESAEVTQ